MNTEARRKAASTYRGRLKAEGYRQKAFLLSPAALDGLKAWADHYGSEAAAIEALLSKSPD